MVMCPINATIPLSDYYSDFKTNNRRKREALALPVTNQDGKQLYNIHINRVLPECFAGWLDLHFDYAGNQVMDFPVRDCGLVDIGGQNNRHSHCQQNGCYGVLHDRTRLS